MCPQHFVLKNSELSGNSVQNLGLNVAVYKTNPEFPTSIIRTTNKQCAKACEKIRVGWIWSKLRLRNPVKIWAGVRLPSLRLSVVFLSLSRQILPSSLCVPSCWRFKFTRFSILTGPKNCINVEICCHKVIQCKNVM